MAAFAFGGLCYATPAAALVAFQTLYPIVGETQYTYLQTAKITAAGALTYDVRTRPLSSNTLTSRTGTLYLTPCDKPDAPYDYANAGAIWAFFFSFTVVLWLIAKNAGLILDFIKRPK